MSLDRLGHYTIVRLLGVGGMGEVYLAEDTKLGRQVALKVLPAAFSGDPERLARMRREARTLASLTHPHIAAIYGFEDSDDTHALVIELADGLTLAETLASAPIPVDDALRIARQLADALEYAHERGVVHRDLKPANIKVCDGAVKVLDFGIATVLEPNAAERARVPTLSHLTQEGTVLGTPAYMSPEQAKGAAVDRRTDIWAFGCVVYEMLTGANVFAGGTSTETLAAVLKSEPDWSRLPAATPSRVRTLLKRCLEKDPRRRLQAIGDARIELDDALGGAVDEPQPTPRRRASLLLAGAAAVAVLLVGFGVWELKPTPSAPPPPVTRFTILLPPEQEVSGVALSRDGRELAYVAATSGGKPQLFVRPIDAVDARAIPGTEGAAGPVFSPDGESIAFFASGSLKRAAIKGGGVQLIATTTRAFDVEAAWGERGAIAFAALLSGLWSVPEQGGSPRVLTRLLSGETQHLSPEFLPGGRAVLFATVGPSRTGIAVESNGSRQDIMSGEGLSSPRLASSGHLIVAQPGGLVAAPFDTARLTLGGTPLRVVDDVAIGANGVALYALSENGSLAYVPGVAQSRRHRLVWVGRDGTEQALPVPPGRYNQPRVSPDGRRIAVDVAEGTAAVKPWQVWLYDLERDTFAPATFGDNNRHAVFAPDGKQFAFMSIRDGKAQVFSQLVDGTGGAQQLTTVSDAPDVLAIPYSWSPDGLLVFVTVTPAGEGDAWLQPVPSAATTATHAVAEVARSAAESTPAQHLFRSRLDDGVPQFSPDGRWLAYTSEESGNNEIYVRPFPDSGGKWQVSVGGGIEPQWNQNGRELFYRTGEKMMAVEIDTRAGFVHGKPKILFEDHYATSLAPGWVNRGNYDVSPDGQRFLMLALADPGRTASNRIEVVLNWTEELKRLAPVTKK
jgi:Tol biopolymer transport system component